MQPIYIEDISIRFNL